MRRDVERMARQIDHGLGNSVENSLRDSIARGGDDALREGERAGRRYGDGFERGTRRSRAGRHRAEDAGPVAGRHRVEDAYQGRRRGADEYEGRRRAAAHEAADYQGRRRAEDAYQGRRRAAEDVYQGRRRAAEDVYQGRRRTTDADYAGRRRAPETLVPGPVRDTYVPRRQRPDDGADYVGRRRAAEGGAHRAVEPGAHRAGVPGAHRAGSEDGRVYAGAFAEQMQSSMNRSLRSLPNIELRANATHAEHVIREVRRDLLELRDQHINLEIDDHTAAAAVRVFRQRIRDAERGATSDRDRANLASAERAFHGFDTMSRESGRRAGESFGGSFDSTVNRRITRAWRALPEITPHFNMTGAEHEIMQVRAELDTLRNVRIGVDMDAGAVMARLALLQARLARLDHEHVDIQIRADAAAAIAEITAAAAAAQAAGAATEVTSGSLGRLGLIIAAVLSVGTALVPAAAGVSVAVAGIATAAGAAAAGLGVLFLGLSGVFGAVQALDKYQMNVGKSAKSMGQSQKQLANTVDGVRSAEMGVAAARESVARGAKQSARAVVDATRAVADAQRAATQAQLDLTKAVEAARRQDEDRALQLRDNALSQRQATLDLAAARAELDTITANPRATAAEREAAQITFEQRMLQIDQLSVAGKRLQQEDADATRKGVMGSDQVVAAQEQVRTSMQGTADAQYRLGEAIDSQHQQQRDGARQIAQAQQGVISAQRALKQAVVSSAVAGGEAYQNLRQQLGMLSLAGEHFAYFIVGLKDKFLELRGTAETGLLPGLQRGIENLMPYFPALERFVGRVATALGGMFSWTVKALENPTWQRFGSFMSSSTVPALEGLARFTEASARGLVALIMALSPFNRRMGEGAVQWARDFATWAEKLEHTDGFRKFLAYVAQAGPRVLDLLGGMATFVKRFVLASAPVGEFVVVAFGLLFKILNMIPLPLLSALIVGVGLLSLALLANAAATRSAGMFTGLLANAGIALGRVQAGVAGILGTYTTAAAGATTATGALATAQGVAAGATAIGARALGGVAGVMTGPWGLAIIGAISALTLFFSTTQDATGATMAQTDALGNLGEAYKKTGSMSSAQVRGVIAQDRNLQKLVTHIDEYNAAARASAYGVGAMGKNAALASVDLDTLGRALAGNVQEQEKLLAMLHDAAYAQPGGGEGTIFDRPSGKRKEILDQADALKVLFANARMAAAADKELAGGQESASEKAKAYAENLLGLSIQARGYTGQAEELVRAFATIGSATASATEKADAYMKAYDMLHETTKKLTNATDEYHLSLNGLGETISQNGATLKGHSDAAIHNRQAIQDILYNIIQLDAEELRNGKTIEQVTVIHQGNIVELEKQAQKLGLNKEETGKLIAEYGRMPTDINTVMHQDGADDVRDKFREILTDVESLLKFGYLPTKVPAGAYWGAPAGRIGGRAEGGLIPGWSPHDKADNIASWLTADEFVEPVASVDYYGVGLFEALRRRAIPREALPGYAEGGLAGRPRQQYPGVLDVPRPKRQAGKYYEGQMAFLFDEVATQVIRKRVMDEAMSRLVPPGGEEGPGWQWMADMFNRRFGTHVGIREADPNRSALTLTGAVSYHTKGRALDLPPKLEYAQWVHDLYGKKSKEIISPWQELNIHNGEPHTYTGAVWNQHNFKGGNAHVHWAMDNGGYLQPGWNPPIYNGLREPEAVLNPGQWKAVMSLAKQSQYGGPQRVNHFTFRDTTLDPGKLRALDDREAALARYGRAR